MAIYSHIQKRQDFFKSKPFVKTQIRYFSNDSFLGNSFVIRMNHTFFPLYAIIQSANTSLMDQKRCKKKHGMQLLLLSLPLN